MSVRWRYDSAVLAGRTIAWRIRNSGAWNKGKDTYPLLLDED